MNVANSARDPIAAAIALAIPVAGTLLGVQTASGLANVHRARPLAIPPVLTNAYVAVRGVDRDVIEARVEWA